MQKNVWSTNDQIAQTERKTKGIHSHESGIDEVKESFAVTCAFCHIPYYYYIRGNQHFKSKYHRIRSVFFFLFCEMPFSIGFFRLKIAIKNIEANTRIEVCRLTL